MDLDVLGICKLCMGGWVAPLGHLFGLLCVCVFVVFVCLCVCVFVVFACLCICCVCVFANCGWVGGPTGSTFGQAMDCKVLQGNVRKGLLPFLRPASIFVNDCSHS